MPEGALTLEQLIAVLQNYQGIYHDHPELPVLVGTYDGETLDADPLTREQVMAVKKPDGTYTLVIKRANKPRS